MVKEDYKWILCVFYTISNASGRNTFQRTYNIWQVADIQWNEIVPLEMNAVYNEIESTLKQSRNDCMKTPATENESKKLENNQLRKTQTT